MSRPTSCSPFRLTVTFSDVIGLSLEPFLPHTWPQGGVPVQVRDHLAGLMLAFASEEVLYPVHPGRGVIDWSEAVVGRFQAPRHGRYLPLLIRDQFRPAPVISDNAGDAAGQRLNYGVTKPFSKTRQHGEVARGIGVGELLIGHVLGDSDPAVESQVLYERGAGPCSYEEIRVASEVPLRI